MPVLDNAHALVVGIADYTTIRRLPKVKDADHVAALLVDPERCGYSKDNVTLLLDQDATKSKLLAALDSLKQRCNADSTVLVYFSGHGGRIKNGPRAGQYLLPVDTVYPDDDDLARTSLSGDDFTAILNSIPARKLLVILDCCHAGGIGETKDLTASDGNFRVGLPESYLDVLKAGRGRAILASSRSTEVSYVRPNATYGVFTHHLLDGLSGGAQGPGGVIRVCDLFDFVQRSIVQDQPDQHPVFKAEIEENFPVALYRGGKAPAPALKTTATDDRFCYDVFLSYRHVDPDKTWVRKTLYPRLKAEGLKVCLDVVDFRLGEPVINEMERAVAQSRYTTAVLTPAYLSSNFTDFENVIAQHLGLEQSQRRFLGLLREPCTPRLGIRALFYLDMSDDDEFDLGVARLAAQLREPPDRTPLAT